MATIHPNSGYYTWGSATDTRFERAWQRSEARKDHKALTEEEQAQEILRHIVCDAEGHTWAVDSQECEHCGMTYIDYFMEQNVDTSWQNWGNYTATFTWSPIQTWSTSTTITTAGSSVLWSTSTYFDTTTDDQT